MIEPTPVIAWSVLIAWVVGAYIGWMLGRHERKRPTRGYTLTEADQRKGIRMTKEGPPDGDR